ncbi:MAG: hypothetical protein HC939_10515 [Pleurocapsa sp. SU_5_0]|nr:hypothetical protein [Pleurocapsa sp. SU_5_0]NJO95771.1 hypothetical protein [Pleurocapsa sp. CRU_1_2]NJR46317.1 hypothetical protein [Hyellaceae cyanobacterium CSU_1_1]
MIKNNRLHRTGWAVGIALVAIAGLNFSALAQSGADDGYQPNEKDGIYGDAPAGLNPLDIIHRAQQTNSRSAAEFDQESQTQIDNSASDFKRLQQQRILEQQQLGQPKGETTETAK